MFLFGMHRSDHDLQQLYVHSLLVLISLSTLVFEYSQLHTPQDTSVVYSLGSTLRELPSGGVADDPSNGPAGVTVKVNCSVPHSAHSSVRASPVTTGINHSDSASCLSMPYFVSDYRLRDSIIAMYKLAT